MKGENLNCILPPLLLVTLIRVTEVIAQVG